MREQAGRAPDRGDYETAYRAALEMVLTEAEKGAHNAGKIVADRALQSIGLDKGEYLPGDRWMSVSLACADARADAAMIVREAGMQVLQELYPDGQDTTGRKECAE